MARLAGAASWPHDAHMGTHLNLLAHRYLDTTSNQSRLATFSTCLRRSLINCIPFLCVLTLCAYAGNNSRAHTPLSTWARSQFFERIRHACLNVANENEVIHSLRRNFLANEKITDQTLLNEFRESGLSHLLALSGGQTTPAAQFICSVFMMLVLILLHVFIKVNAVKIIQTLRILTYVTQTATLIFLVGLYQATGALNRTCCSQLAAGARASALLFQGGNTRGAIWIHPLLLASPWLLGFFLHQNPVGDLSFLLSALGAVTSSVMSRTLGFLWGDAKVECFPQHLSWLLQSKSSKAFLLWILSTAATSSVMCLLTWPLWPADNILPKIQANIIAGPCVLFLITPASLGVCLGVLLGLPYLEKISHLLLDVGLNALHLIAQTFSSVAGEETFTKSSDLLATKTSGHLISPQMTLVLEIFLLTLTLECLSHLQRSRASTR